MTSTFFPNQFHFNWIEEGKTGWEMYFVTHYPSGKCTTVINKWRRLGLTDVALVFHIECL